MENNHYKKVIIIAYLAAGFIAFQIMAVLIDVASAGLPFVRNLNSQDWFQHGLPLLTGAAVFCYLFFNPKIRTGSLDITQEISKVVWPTKPNTISMTIVTSILIVIVGYLLAIFDMSSESLVKFILSL